MKFVVEKTPKYFYDYSIVDKWKCKLTRFLPKTQIIVIKKVEMVSVLLSTQLSQVFLSPQISQILQIISCKWISHYTDFL